MSDVTTSTESDWRGTWVFRIACALALWGFGIVGIGLLLFGVIAQAQGVVPGPGPMLSIVAGGVATVAYVVLCRLSVRAGLTLRE